MTYPVGATKEHFPPKIIPQPWGSGSREIERVDTFENYSSGVGAAIVVGAAAGVLVGETVKTCCSACCPH